MELKPGYKQTQVGVIPEEWQVKRLGDLFEITSSKRVFQSEWRTQGVPFYRARELAVLSESGSVNNELFITQKMYDAFKRAYGVPKAGDMLVTGVGTLGKVYVVTGGHEFYFKDGNIIWFKIAENVRPEFLRQLYLTPLITKQISDGSAGTTVGTYTISGAKKTIIPFPPLPEQRAIAAVLGDIDTLLGALEKLIVKKRDLKQAAMQQLLTGQKRLPGFTRGWGLNRLGDVTDIDPENLGSDTRSDFPFNYISLEDVDQGTLKSYSEQVFRTAPSRARRKLRKHDVLVSTVRPNLKSHFLFGAEEQVWVCSTGFCVVRCRERVTHPGYVFFHLFGDYVARQIKALLTGSNYPAINSRDVRALEIPLPEYAEQTAIASVLSDMDAEIAALEQRLSKTHALKQGMMQELLTGKTRLM